MGPGAGRVDRAHRRHGVDLGGGARHGHVLSARAAQLVEALNAAYREPAVTTAIGGQKGGGARVTPYGRRLAALFRAMEQKASAAIAADLKRYARHLR